MTKGYCFFQVYVREMGSRKFDKVEGLGYDPELLEFYNE